MVHRRPAILCSKRCGASGCKRSCRSPWQATWSSSEEVKAPIRNLIIELEQGRETSHTVLREGKRLCLVELPAMRSSNPQNSMRKRSALYRMLVQVYQLKGHVACMQGHVLHGGLMQNLLDGCPLKMYEADVLPLSTVGNFCCRWNAANALQTSFKLPRILAWGRSLQHWDCPMLRVQGEMQCLDRATFRTIELIAGAGFVNVDLLCFPSDLDVTASLFFGMSGWHTLQSCIADMRRIQPVQAVHSLQSYDQDIA